MKDLNKLNFVLEEIKKDFSEKNVDKIKAILGSDYLQEDEVSEVYNQFLSGVLIETYRNSSSNETVLTECILEEFVWSYYESIHNSCMYSSGMDELPELLSEYILSKLLV